LENKPAKPWQDCLLCSFSEPEFRRRGFCGCGFLVGAAPFYPTRRRAGLARVRVNRVEPISAFKGMKRTSVKHRLMSLPDPQPG
jgi:hypothetical protein